MTAVRLALGLSIMAVILGVVALVLSIVLPGAEGPQGIQGPQGPGWTLSAQRYEWTLGPDEWERVWFYLGEGDVLEGCILAAPVTRWHIHISDPDHLHIRFYQSSDGYPIGFRYVAETNGDHWLGLTSDNYVDEDVALVYWVI